MSGVSLVSNETCHATVMGHTTQVCRIYILFVSLYICPYATPHGCHPSVGLKFTH
jgi:hypothetical protein